MKKELAVLNFLCVVIAVGFLVFAVVNALTSGTLLSTDNLFVTMVCLLMAVMFIVNPLLYLNSEGKLPVPFLKRSATPPTLTGKPTERIAAPANTAPLLDTKGRAVPPDVKAIMSRMGTTNSTDT